MQMVWYPTTRLVDVYTKFSIVLLKCGLVIMFLQSSGSWNLWNISQIGSRAEQEPTHRDCGLEGLVLKSLYWKLQILK